MTQLEDRAAQPALPGTALPEGTVPGNKRTKRQILSGLIHRASKDHVNAYAASAAYFLILSFIPFVLFLTTLIRFTDISYNTLSDAIRSVVPAAMQSFVLGVVSEVYNRSGAIMPITFLLTIWSSGQAIQALINGLNTVFHVEETRNWLMNRIIAMGYTVILSFTIILSLLFLVLGDKLHKLLLQYAPTLGTVMDSFMWIRTLLLYLVIFLVFLFFYKVLPNRKATFRSQIPGAILLILGWLIFSSLFSLYFTIFPNISNMYGSMTALAVVMIWLYFIMMIVMYGAEMNAYFENEFRIVGRSVKKVISKRQERKAAEKELKEQRREESRRKRRKRRKKSGRNRRKESRRNRREESRRDRREKSRKSEDESRKAEDNPLKPEEKLRETEGKCTENTGTGKDTDRRLTNGDERETHGTGGSGQEQD